MWEIALMREKKNLKVKVVKVGQSQGRRPSCQLRLLKAVLALSLPVNQSSHHQAIQRTRSTKNVTIVVLEIRPTHRNDEKRGSSLRMKVSHQPSRYGQASRLTCGYQNPQTMVFMKKSLPMVVWRQRTTHTM